MVDSSPASRMRAERQRLRSAVLAEMDGLVGDVAGVEEAKEAELEARRKLVEESEGRIAELEARAESAVRMLVDSYDQSPAAVARLCGIPLGDVKVMLRRARSADPAAGTASTVIGDVDA